MSTLLSAPQIRELADRLGVRPTKTLGQNFVIDPNTVRRIVRVAEVVSTDVVLEVGPGLGSLTLALLPEVAGVTAVEIDPVLAGALPETVEALAPELLAKLRVVGADALTIRAADLGFPAPTMLVANLPYNVAVPVLLHCMATLPTLRGALVMVQAEVAARLAAPPGSRVYGVPSVKARWYGDVRTVGSIGRSVFWPAPNVDSGLVLLRRGPTREGDREAVFAVVDAAFAQRRKMLRAALGGWAGSPARAEEILRSVGVDPTLRGEQLDVEDYVRIAAGKAG